MNDIAQFQTRLENAGYVAERDLAATLHLMTHLRRPLLVEGDAGVGKTEIAKALARLHGCELIRLQCYEGLDASSAVYEWNYQHQLLTIKMLESDARALADKEAHVFSDKYLLKRPLLAAISQPQSPVLLIDEIDRADEEFEAYLLEVLSDYQISVPEIGTIKARSIPYVVLTSNATRELSDALRRRCLYFYVDYPSFEKELSIVKLHLPEIGERLAQQIVEYVQALRKTELRRRPGLAETLDWAAALLALKVLSLDNAPEQILGTLVCLLKTKEDREAVTRDVSERLRAKAI